MPERLGQGELDLPDVGSNNGMGAGMLGWLRRKDGFEWHKYVRTTILVRRQDRRRKVEQAGQAVAAGVGEAGRSAVGGLNATISAIGRWLATAQASLLTGIGAAASALSSSISDQTLGTLAPKVRIVSAFVAVAAAAFALARWQGNFAAPDFAIPLGIAAVSALIATGGWIATTIGAPARLGWSALVAKASTLPGLARLGERGVGYGFAALIMLALAGGALAVLGRPSGGLSLPSLSMMSAPLIEGRATALSGDVLKVGEQLVRLDGIEAPEREQRCVKGTNRRWRCGVSAADALAARVKGKPVTCTSNGTDDAGRVSARCTVAGADLGEALVGDGHVFASGGLFSRYGTAETEARNRKVGIWAGEVERPAEFRSKRWDAAKLKAPSGCPIKGQVTQSGRQYFAPWSPGYDRIRVRKTRGERWFCSETEAVAAGFKASERG